VIISEASLSFLGFGLPIRIPNWGGMLSREGREFMEMAPRLALWPGLCLTVVVYALNMFGDVLRDLLDPRLRGGESSYGTAVVKRKKGFLSRLINIRANHYELTN
jgi:peptide/nickel transport system permease protein